ncbi:MULTISPECIES: glycosyltransferase [Acinetobacter]|jgi:glycosyltransferase involved in cell wall biosynthesis|uniref:Glycosyltransferase n=1 Tax=Acinetobacter radioresistens TaxID=40216 RepID=A0A8H2K2W4_ACIRA|nr:MULTISPECIES: glycosyltransferase [Acinetobacter]KCX38195.1 glycosyl transferases group 1 family protein [Acinetobacter sp. 263903-1]TNX92135.1 glycosyltransferase [Acinetobacter radioresistens]WGX73157.1 glycosyltransferase [Acinetobacter radioresistens]
MNITLVMAGDEEGGLEKHVVELANGLQARGHTVTVIAHAKYQERLAKVNFIAVDLSKSRRNIGVLYQLYKVIKILNADVIHVHGNKAAAMVSPLLPFLQLKSVATLHSRKKNTKVFKRFNAVIAVSPNAAEVLEHPHKHVVLNGIEPPVLDENIPKHEPAVVLAVGRLVPVKGFDVLIEAWQGIQNAELWIVGDGFEHEKLQGLITQFNLQHSVKLLGFRSDIVELMQQASLYVMSSHYEGCPYTMIEALLCRIPMVSTAVGAMTMVLPKQYLCPVNDAKALNQQISHSLNNLESVQQNFQSVFEFAAKELVLDGMLQNIEKIYDEVLSAK